MKQGWELLWIDIRWALECLQKLCCISKRGFRETTKMKSVFQEFQRLFKFYLDFLKNLQQAYFFVLKICDKVAWFQEKICTKWSHSDKS